jgi:hypothetical protein
MGNQLAKRGRKVKKITYKDLAVRWAMNNYTGYAFTKNDHDACDAICLGAAFLS